MNWQHINTLPTDRDGEYFVWSLSLGLLLCVVWENDDDDEEENGDFTIIFKELTAGGDEVFGDLDLTHWSPFPDGPAIITDLAN